MDPKLSLLGSGVRDSDCDSDFRESQVNGRQIAVRTLAGLFAVSWIVLPGFGAIDLSVTWSADWPQVLEAGWGLFFTVLVGAAFVLVAVRPRASMPAVLQLMVATVVLAVSAVVGEEIRLFWLVAALALQTAIVGGLSRRARREGTDTRVPRPRVSRLLLLLAGVGVVPWLAYALHMWTLNREGRLDSDFTLGVDHYSVQGALALALALLPPLAALRSDVCPFVPACAGVAAFYLGLVSLAWDGAAGGLGRAWSAAAIAWGLALLAVTVVRRLREVPLEPEECSG